MDQELFSFIIEDPISSLDLSKEFMVCGTLDEKLYIWKDIQNNSKHLAKLEGHLMGIVDVKIDENETKVAVSCLDSVIRIWDLEDTTRKCSEITCDPFENWKVQFLDNFTLITAGEAGIVSMYHTETRDRIMQIETDKVYYNTSLNQQKQDYSSSIITVGNEGGFLYLIQNNKVYGKLKAHGKSILDIQFLSSNKLLTSSDDGLIKLIDMEKLSVETYFPGHKNGVNSIDIDPNNPKNFVSCAQDRTIKFWSLETKQANRTIYAGLDKPETINKVKFIKNGTQICAAHQSGILAFYSV